MKKKGCRLRNPSKCIYSPCQTYRRPLSLSPIINLRGPPQAHYKVVEAEDICPAEAVEVVEAKVVEAKAAVVEAKAVVVEVAVEEAVVLLTLGLWALGHREARKHLQQYPPIWQDQVPKSVFLRSRYLSGVPQFPRQRPAMAAEGALSHIPQS